MVGNIILAADVKSYDSLYLIINQVKNKIEHYKIGPPLIYNTDPRLFEKLTIKYPNKIFLDLKFVGTPSSIIPSIEAYDEMNLFGMTVYVGDNNNITIPDVHKFNTPIIAVISLTSNKEVNPFDIYAKFNELIDKGYQGAIVPGNQVGVINNLQKVNFISNGKKFLKICPGIRPVWYLKKDDQIQTSTPRKAIVDGADYVIIGRPILQASMSIQNALDRIIEEINIQ